jgi:hypothetical protein
MDRVTGCGGWRDIDVLHGARLGLDPCNLAREANCHVHIAALPRQGVGPIGDAWPRIDQDSAHVGSIQVQDFDFVRHAPAEEAIATDNAFNPNVGRGTLFMDPRRAMVSVRLNLDR